MKGFTATLLAVGMTVGAAQAQTELTLRTSSADGLWRPAEQAMARIIQEDVRAAPC